MNNTGPTTYDFADVTSIISHALSLTTRLDRTEVLQTFVDSAVELSGARYGAMSVLDSRGETLEFVFSGIPKDHAKFIGNPPKGRGVFGDIPNDSYLIVNDLESYPNRFPWPSNHPLMHNFLGVPVRMLGRVFGRLYLADKAAGFTDADGRSMELLAQAAAIAVENARIYTESSQRAQWIAASRAITTALLEGSDEEEALQLIAREMRRVAQAEVALIILPSVGDSWVCEIACGTDADHFIGVNFPPTGRAQAVIREGTGLIVDSMLRQSLVRVPELMGYGPALYAPMMSKGTPQGVILLLRDNGRPEFDLADLSMAEAVARQAALALELANARLSQSQAAQLEDRAQISRDLHDLAIQQLFASGMELTAVRDGLATESAVPSTVIEKMDNAIQSIDESVTQIRQIIYALRDPSATTPVVERLRHEATKARSSLGFHPTLSIRRGDEEIISGPHTEIDDELGSDIADDVVAVVRECLSNAARHAHATKISVDVHIGNRRVEVHVEDNGQGVNPALSRRSGLSNLAARARRHHGTFSIRPGGDGAGTTVEWTALVD